MKTAEDIVRALATAETPTMCDDIRGERCALCRGPYVWGSPEGCFLHAEDCPYLMAVRWVAATDAPAAEPAPRRTQQPAR